LFYSEEEVVKETSLPTTEPKTKESKKSEPKTPRVDKKSKTSTNTDKVQDSDRAAESPPCEVSSTTIIEAEKMSKRLKSGTVTETAPSEKSVPDKTSGKKATAVEKVSELEKVPVVSEVVRTPAVIAETSATVVIEGLQVTRHLFSHT
jgi:hypothetical protein